MAEAAPRANLPSPGVKRLPRGWIIGGVGALCLFLFADFLIASFPYSDTLARVLAPYQLKLVYQEQHLSLPIGVELERVNLFSTAEKPDRLLLQSPTVSLAPVITSLIFGRPRLRLDARLYGGFIRATVRQTAEVIDGDFQLEDLSLAESQPLRQFGMLLGGDVSGTGSAKLGNGDLMADSGDARIVGANVTLEITRGFPRIQLGAVSGHLELASGIVTFEDLETHGGDVEAKADGEIRLAPNLAESTITARVYLTPTPNGRDHFGLFFNMLPHPPAEGPFYLSGPLAAPSIN
jgi:type II secretion system protein N